MSITLMKQALELLMVATFNSPELQAKRTEVINAGLAAIKQAEKQEPVAWMDGYRNIYSLEEKAAGCEDAVIPLVPAIQHWSDCAVHNEPAYPKGDCDCGGYTTPPAAPVQEPVMRRTTREEKIVRPGIYEVMRDVLSATPPAAPVQETLTWYEGAPPFPQDQEWFIAETIYGDRVVLRSLDEGRERKGNYAFKTADQTYMKQEIVKRWMQFPDCEYLPPAAQRQWVGLTDAEILEVLCIWPDPDDDPDDYMEDIREARAIEAKLREKNGARSVLFRA